MIDTQVIFTEMLKGYAEVTLRYWPLVFPDKPYLVVFHEPGTTNVFCGQAKSSFEDALANAISTKSVPTGYYSHAPLPEPYKPNLGTKKISLAGL